MEYLLKMIACSAVLYAGYHWLLSQEKMLVFNRFYLLAGLILPFLIPLIEIQVAAPRQADLSGYSLQAADAGDQSLDLLIRGCVWLSAVISALLLLRFGRNLRRLRRTTRRHPRSYYQGVPLVLMEPPVAIFSFFNHIFIDRTIWEAGEMEPEVLEHELAHIRQKHSWDIVLLELLTALCWFNPLLYLYKKAIKINHELLADAAVLKKFDDPRSYQLILVRRAGAQPAPALVSSFHFFTIKKRVLMLQKKSHPFRAGCKAFAVSGLLALLVFSFGKRVYAQTEKPPPPPPVAIEPVVTKLHLPEGVESLRMTGDKNKTWAVLKYKNGKTIREEVTTPAQQAAFEKKYGATVVPPPPPKFKKRKQDPGMPAPPPPPAPLKESTSANSLQLEREATASVAQPAATAAATNDRKEQIVLRLAVPPADASGSDRSPAKVSGSLHGKPAVVGEPAIIRAAPAGKTQEPVVAGTPVSTIRVSPQTGVVKPASDLKKSATPVITHIKFSAARPAVERIAFRATDQATAAEN